MRSMGFNPTNDELQVVLIQHYSKDRLCCFQDLIMQVDRTCSGKLSFPGFLDMMSKILETRYGIFVRSFLPMALKNY